MIADMHRGLLRAGTVRGVPVRLHWSVPIIAMLLLAVNRDVPIAALAGSTAYLAMLLIHECGHAAVARMRRCEVTEIDLYPLHGTCHFIPNFAEDRVFVAWGGVAAQLAVAVPLIAFAKISGGTHILAIDAAIGILGFLSLFVAIFNLLPVRPLDGWMAWRLIPMMFKRKRSRDKSALEAMNEAVRNATRSRGRK